MKRMIFNLSVAFLTFCIGLTADVALRKYVEVSLQDIDAYNEQPSLIGLSIPLPLERYASQLPASSLPAELQRIDRKYQRRCQLPTDWTGQWPTILQLDGFSKCNEDWARARRNAIKSEFQKYMVRY